MPNLFGQDIVYKIHIYTSHEIIILQIVIGKLKIVLIRVH